MVEINAEAGTPRFTILVIAIVAIYLAWFWFLLIVTRSLLEWGNYTGSMWLQVFIVVVLHLVIKQLVK